MAVVENYPNRLSNEVTDHEAIDPLSGTAVLHGIPVEVVAAG